MPTSTSRTCVAQILMYTRIGAKVPDDGPRPAPARLKPLEFPHYHVQGDLNAAHQRAQDLSRLFLGLEKTISAKHIEALNITPVGEVPLDRLIPGKYLPSKQWFEEPSLTAQSPIVKQHLSGSRPAVRRPGHKEFYSAARELRYQSDECFDSLPGRPRGKGPVPVKLFYTHKFYQNLLLMAESWDTSKDSYMTDENGKEMYTGRRYNAGHEMPPHYREDTVSAFVELCAWPFQCTLQKPWSSVNRLLQFQNRYFPIQSIMSAICLNPTDRQKARRGVLEGPLVGIHCRNTTVFRNAIDKEGEGREEIMDILFEVGAALLVAQKRAREGKGEEKPWKDKFWTDAKRRHLGELGGGRQDYDTNTRARKEIEAAKSGGEPMEGVEMDKEKGNGSSGNEPKKRKYNGPKQVYWDTKPPESLWESKIEYRMIGKEPGTGVDNVIPSPTLTPHVPAY
ncbi:MAG: hypothetical protein Q9166_002090 [cf. Caloplaca sp. 2 TL-2023]